MTDDLPRRDGAPSDLPADAALRPAASAPGPTPEPRPLVPDAPHVPDAPLALDAPAATPGADAASDATYLAAGGPADGDQDMLAAAAPAPAGRRGIALAAAALAVVVVIEVVVIGALLVASGNGGSSGTAAADPGTAPVLGTASAPVLIEIWADYQCPYCGALTHVLEPSLQRDYVAPGKARVVFRDFSFLGQESTEAAAAARCSGQQGAYWHFHDLLFASQQGENQGAFAPTNIMKLATYAGLDTDAFAACMTDQAVRTAVEAETARGRAFGVESTPTLRIVGPAGTKTIKGLSTLAVVDAAITEVLTGVAPSAAPGASGSPTDAPASTPSGPPAGGTAPSPSGAPSGASAAP